MSKKNKLYRAAQDSLFKKETSRILDKPCPYRAQCEKMENLNNDLIYKNTKRLYEAVTELAEGNEGRFIFMDPDRLSQIIRFSCELMIWEDYLSRLCHFPFEKSKCQLLNEMYGEGTGYLLEMISDYLKEFHPDPTVEPKIHNYSGYREFTINYLFPNLKYEDAMALINQAYKEEKCL